MVYAPATDGHASGASVEAMGEGRQGVKKGTKATAEKVATSTIALKALTPDDHNANKGTPRGTGMLEESLRKFGAGRSILADKNLRIIAGNKTVEGAASIGLDDAIVVQSDGTRLVVVQRTDLDLDDPQTREFALADNRVGEVNLEWDADALQALQQQGADLSAWFKDYELNLLIDVSEKANDPNAEWQGMPRMEAQPRAIQTILVHFKTRQDVADFAKRIGQELNDGTKWIYYPKQNKLPTQEFTAE